MCVVFVRTRNLLAPVLVHSAWNAWVLAGDFLPPLDVVLRAVFAAAP
jgi:membrane protease YdiL (CAAX protease family)